MKIEASDLKAYATLGGLGGTITATEIAPSIHNIFSKVDAGKALLGSTEYQCIYFKNNHPTLILLEAALHLVSNTPNANTTLFVGLGSSAVGGTEQVITDINTPPVGITFTEVEGDILPIGDIPQGSHKAIWLRRVINTDTQASANDGATISLVGKTEATL